MRNAIQGPVIFGIAVVKRPALKGAKQTSELRWFEAARATGLSAAGLLSGLFGFLPPPSHAAFCRADPLGDLLRTLSTSQQVSGTLAAARPLLTRSEWSHAPNYRASATAPDINY